MSTPVDSSRSFSATSSTDSYLPGAINLLVPVRATAGMMDYIYYTYGALYLWCKKKVCFAKERAKRDV